VTDLCLEILREIDAQFFILHLLGEGRNSGIALQPLVLFMSFVVQLPDQG